MEMYVLIYIYIYNIRDLGIIFKTKIYFDVSDFQKCVRIASLGYYYYY